MSGSRQGGAGALSFLVTAATIVIAIVMSIRMVPLYLDDYAISKVLSSLDRKPELESATLEQTRAWLEKGFESNRIELGDNEVHVRRPGNQLSVDIDYERRIHLLYNMDLVLTFEHDWKIKPK